MALTRFAIGHLWWLVALAGLGIGLALVLRARVTRMLRLARAAATDKRLPGPVRWVFKLGLAIKLVPGPDFGIDEVLLLVGAGLLAGPYRSIWVEIRKDVP